MPEVVVRCYAELNEHLPAAARGKPIRLTVADGTLITQILDRLSIPPHEVDLVLVNGGSTTFDHRVVAGDYVSLFPLFETFDIDSVQQLRHVPLRSPRFLLDVHLGHLARYLRMLGFDAMYESGFEDVELSAISLHEQRTLLTRDGALAAQQALTHVYRITSEDPREQLREVVGRFNLLRSIQPFRRCLVCNAVLRTVDKEEIVNEIPPGVREAFTEFHRCPGCHRIFWKGSHYKRMEALVAGLRSAK